MFSLGFTLVHMGSLGFTWVYLGSLGFTSVHLSSLWFTWVHSGLSGLIWKTRDEMGHIGGFGSRYTYIHRTFFLYIKVKVKVHFAM